MFGLGLAILAGACGSDSSPAPEADAGLPGDDCFSPFVNLDRAYASFATGCACEPTPVNVAGVCVAGAALFCTDGRWQSAEDGPCEPGPPLTVEQCREREGYPQFDPGDGSLSRTCPAPQATLGALAGGEGGRCCGLAELTNVECVALGHRALSDPGDNSLHEAGCPAPSLTIGRYVTPGEGGLCCSREE